MLGWCDTYSLYVVVVAFEVRSIHDTYQEQERIYWHLTRLHLFLVPVPVVVSNATNTTLER